MGITTQTPYGEVTISFIGTGDPAYRGQPAYPEATASFEPLTVNRLEVRGWLNFSKGPQGWRVVNGYVRRVGSYTDNLSWNLRTKINDALLAAVEKHGDKSTLDIAEATRLVNQSQAKHATAESLRAQAQALDVEADALLEQADAIKAGL